MQTCENINTSLIVPPDYILKRFMVLESLGSGYDGLVIKALDTETNEVVALKSQPIIGDKIEMKEIQIGCTLFPTRPYTHSIIMPIHWAIVSKNVFLDGTIAPLPNWWYNKYPPIRSYDGNKRFKMETTRGLIFTMPLMDYTLKEKYPSLTIEEKRDILFELIVAVRSLNNMGIRHNDLTSTNILLKQTQELRSYTVNNIQNIVNSQYMPIIIDLAHAEIGLDVTDFQDYFRRDWISILNPFIEDIPDDIQILFEGADISVLSHKFFQPLRERSVEPESLVRIFAPLESL